MATAKKLPSGSWRVRVSKTIDGQVVVKSITAATKAEAEYLGEQWRASAVEASKPENKTLREVVDLYVDLKRPVLSPTTVAEYERIPKNYFAGYWDIRCRDLTRAKLQQMVSEECLRTTRRGKRVSAKSVANAWGLVSSALRFFGYDFRVQLPERPEKVVDVLPPQVILPLVVGTSIELPVLLACWCSLTMSEIQGIRPEDLHGDILYINQVVVQVNGADIAKSSGKEERRTRAVSLPDYVQALFSSWDGTWMRPKSIYKRWSALVASAGYPHMTFHQLRHVFATSGAMLNVPQKVLQEMGGWKTPHTMEKVYQHTFRPEREAGQRAIDEYYQRVLDGIPGSGRTGSE